MRTFTLSPKIRHSYNEFNSATNIDFHLFADDSNLFCSHKKLQSLEQNLNMQLHNVNQWLCANKLSLNIDKSNFVIFRPPQKKIEYTVKLQINNKIIEEKKCIKYLGIFIDCHLNWKEHVHELSKKNSKRNWHFIKTETFCFSLRQYLSKYTTLLYILSLFMVF